MKSLLDNLPPWLRWIFFRRLGNAFGFFICAALLGYGFYLQFAMDLQPCPLCILQRLCLFATGVMFLLAALHDPLKRWAAHLYGGLICACALVGLSIATRHVWLQHTPESQRPACGPRRRDHRRARRPRDARRARRRRRPRPSPPTPDTVPRSPASRARARG